VQIDTLRTAFLQRVGIVFFHKKLRSRQTEAVDTLLDVPHHEQVVRSALLSRDRPKKRLLHMIAVLILVDHDLLVHVAELLRRSARLLCLCIHENLQCEMLQIVKIHQILAALFRCKRLGECDGKTHQFLRHRLCPAHLPAHDFRRCKEILLVDLFYRILHLVAEFLHTRKLPCISRKAAARRQPVISDGGKLFVQFQKIFTRRQSLELCEIRRDHLLIDIRSVFLPRKHMRDAKLFYQIRQHRPQMQHERLHPWRFCHLLHIRYLIATDAGSKPLHRPRVAHGELIEREDHLRHLRITLPRHIPFCKCRKLRCHLFVIALQHAAQHVLF